MKRMSLMVVALAAALFTVGALAASASPVGNKVAISKDLTAAQLAATPSAAAFVQLNQARSGHPSLRDGLGNTVEACEGFRGNPRNEKGPPLRAAPVLYGFCSSS